MTSPADIAADPAWLPHRIDSATRQVEFLRLERDVLAADGFLADRDPGSRGRALASWSDVQAMRIPEGRLHFVFHTAFCRSTLLIRALDLPGKVVGLNEPGIVASMVNAGPAAAALHAPLLALLARPHRPGEVVVVKPTNHANALMPALLAARPDARAILMTHPLPSFLASVARKGLMGRNWARRLFLEMQGYAGMDFGMSPQESFALTDMQAAALAWFLAQRWFDAHLRGGVRGVASERLRVLDGDRFAAAREETLAAAANFFGVADPEGAAATMACSPVFTRHAKSGTPYSGDAPSKDPMLAEEIAQVGQWLALIAQQAGVPVPVEQTLL